jgi:CheY-like chemotaxis protein
MPQMTSVLIVEDDPEIRYVLAAGLRRLGYDVRVAADGLEALTMLSLNAIEIIVTDLGMPRMDGWELMQVCRESPPFNSIPILVMSGSPALADLAYARGATGFLVKPFSWTDAHAAIQATLEKGSGGAHA